MLDNMSTNSLIGITGAISGVSWIATLGFGFVLYSYLTLGQLVIAISIGWLVVTAITSLYIVKKSEKGLIDLNVWKVWLALSVIGCVVNIVAGAFLEVGLFVDQGTEPIKTAPMEYGVILPWTVIYAIGYLFTAFYELDNQSLSKKERAVYAAIGVVSGILAVALGLSPSLHTPIILALTVLTLAQMTAIPIRNRVE